MTRVAIFIDGGYFRAYLRQIGEPRIDFLKLSQKLSKPDDLFRTYYYNCMPYQSNPPRLKWSAGCMLMQTDSSFSPETPSVRAG